MIGGIYLFVFIFDYVNCIICIRLVFQLHGFLLIWNAIDFELL